ncbi:MAG TPA: hypothetical protein VMV38_01695 [Candidatus Paceibacterota bacterium]|nr:hypothetical protein [Candidatus Paceibacterota bacterium]
MNKKLTNLLPRVRRAALTREYLYRVGVIATSLFIALISAAALLLLPTYIYVAQTAQIKETRLASIRSALVSTDRTTVAARLAALSKDTSALVALSTALSPSSVMNTILALPRPGITLSSFGYMPHQGTIPPTLTLSGIAITRDALRTYQLTLQGAPLVRTADLPVSAYAQDTNIDFTITLTLSP